MKIAVATTDGASLSQHFGQSKGFVVFEVDGAIVKNQEVRFSGDTPHNQGICNHSGDNQQAAHSHANIFELLGDCEVVLCGGMGAGAAQSLIANGIKPVVMSGAKSAYDAAVGYVQGNSTASEPGFCSCHH